MRSRDYMKQLRCSFLGSSAVILKSKRGKRFPIGYLQHSTHAQEMDNIWDGQTATFKWKSKLAKLQFYADHCNIMSWKEGGDHRPVLRASVNVTCAKEKSTSAVQTAAASLQVKRLQAR